MTLHRRNRRRTASLRLAVLLPLVAGLGACGPTMVVGAGATAGIAATEERGPAAAIDDNTIALSINKLWLDHDWRIFRDVSTSVTEGRVLLTGKVESPEHELEAVRLAWQAEGVRAVIDEIKVTNESSVMDYARDTWISTQLRTAITFDEKIRAVNYNVVTVDGVVYLMGLAQSQEEIERVLDYARDIRYVRNVVSHVLVKTDPRRGA
ncbi:MAG: BON domain-containing protein [Alphaproteobacteria bacterium]